MNAIHFIFLNFDSECDDINLKKFEYLLYYFVLFVMLEIPYRIAGINKYKDNNVVLCF